MEENLEGKTGEESECLVKLMDISNMVTKKKKKRLKYTDLHYKI